MALSLNKQKEKAWTELIKQEAKTFGWKFKGWFAYRVSNGFFYEVNFTTYGYANKIDGAFYFKPLLIDELFWDIVDLSE